jgi:hypothetical protein
MLQSQKTFLMMKLPALHCLLQHTSVGVKHKPNNVHVLRQGREALQVLHIFEDSFLGAIFKSEHLSTNF